MKTIGITGPSGSGKSRISALLRGKGYPVIDVDTLAKEIRPRFVNEIKSAFGEKYVNDKGEVNSKELALLVFNDRIEMERLNKITFPAILEEMNKIIATYKALGSFEFLFFDIAVLFHSGAEKLFDHIVLVTASRLTRMERLIKLRNVPIEVAIAQVDSVLITHAEMERCSLTLLNEGDEQEVHAKLLDWLENLKVGSRKMSGKIEPVSAIPGQLKTNVDSRDLQDSHKKEFADKLQKAIKEKKKKKTQDK